MLIQKHMKQSPLQDPCYIGQLFGKAFQPELECLLVYTEPHLLPKDAPRYSILSTISSLVTPVNHSLI